VQFVISPSLAKLPGWHGFSTRAEGQSISTPEAAPPANLTMGFTAEDDPRHILRNRQLHSRSVNGSSANHMCPLLRQIHSGMLVIPESARAVPQLPT